MTKEIDMLGRMIADAGGDHPLLATQNGARRP